MKELSIIKSNVLRNFIFILIIFIVTLNLDSTSTTESQNVTYPFVKPKPIIKKDSILDARKRIKDSTEMIKKDIDQKVKKVKKQQEIIKNE